MAIDPTPAVQMARQMLAETNDADAAAAAGADTEVADDGADAVEGAGADEPRVAAAEKKPAPPPVEKKPEDRAAKEAADAAEEGEAAKKDPQVARGMDFVARKSQREQERLDARAAQVAAEAKALEPLRAISKDLGADAEKVLAVARKIAKLGADPDPYDVLLAAGVTDLGAASKRLVTRGLGDKAPVDMKLDEMQRAHKREIERLETEIKKRDEERETTTRRAELAEVAKAEKANLTAAVEKAPADQFPILRAHGEKAIEGLFEFRRQYWERTGDVLAYDDLIPLFEEALAEELPPGYVEWAKSQKKATPKAADKAKTAPKEQPKEAGEEQAATTLTEKDAKASTRGRKDPDLDAVTLDKLRRNREARSAR